MKKEVNEKNRWLYEQIKNYSPVNKQEENDKKLMLKSLEEFDDVLTRDNEMFHFTTSAWVVNHDRSKVLMIYHNIYNSWAWIGGHADGNPKLVEVAKKEVEEETGVSNLKLLVDGVFGLSILGVTPHVKRGKYVSAHLHYDLEFLFEASEDEGLRIAPNENSNVGWIDVSTLFDEVNEEHMKPIYKKLTDKVKDLNI